MSVRGSEQAVVTDFDEAFGQDFLKEAADKLLGGNGRESGLISGRILVGKSHLAILEGEDPAIADGDAKDVRSEVFEGGGACAYRLRVNDPIFAPDLLVKEMEEIALFEQIPELGAEQDRERLDVNKVAHQTVDEIGGELLSFDGEMRIETGGRRGTVTEVLLNETKVDAGLQ